MAVFFDHRVQAPANGNNSNIQWHSNYPVLASAVNLDSGGGAVNIYLEEGEHVSDAVLNKPCSSTALAWHPTRRVLCVAWETGEIQIWNDQDKENYDAPHLHQSDVTRLEWSSNGTRLLSADSSGMIVLWKADSRGRLQQNPLLQHPLGEGVTEVLLRPPPPVDPANDIASLARAAVSGDESALDMFNWKKGKNNGPRLGASFGNQEALTYFIGGQNGGVYYLNENSKVVQSFESDGSVRKSDGAIRKLLYYEEKNILLTVTSTMILSQYNVSPEGDIRELLKVKMSGRSEKPDITWAGKGILATATGESIIRMWDIEKEENFILNLEGQQGYNTADLIMCISYCQTKGILAGGTGSGHIAMWKFSPVTRAQAEPEDQWKLQPPCSVPGSLSALQWGSSKCLLAANAVENVYILSQQVISANYCNQTAVVQSGPMSLSVDVFTNSMHHDLKTDIQIKGVYCTKENIMVMDGKKVVVYEITPNLIRPIGTFTTEASVIKMYGQSLYCLEAGKVQVRTFQGTSKQLLTFTDAEGYPVSVDVCGNFLTIASSNCVVKVYDLSRREAKQHCNPKNFTDVIPGLGGIVSAKCNCNGSRVSLVVNQANGAPDPKLYIWDSDLDTVQFFSFETGRGEQDEYIAQSGDLESDASDLDKGKNQAAKDVAGRYPVSHYWDVEEVKLCVCEAKILPPNQLKNKQQSQKAVSLNRNTMDDTVEIMIVSLFVTPENGILIQDSFPIAQNHHNIIGLEVPFVYYMKKADEFKDSEDNMNTIRESTQSAGFQRFVQRRVLRDFVGLEDADKNARDAMMNFSFYLTIGNMDEAFKAIKLIKTESVWENMAKMCVKTRRLDVASVCLGNMGHARGAKALRESHNEEELDAKVAALAIQLSLYDDAERLLKNCKRYDLLNELYQSSGQWSKALETAEMYDRVHLRTTYYSYAKHLETNGDVNGAIPNFEKSDTHRFEVPRMLYDEPQALENYIMRSKDKALKKWWAQYMESTGEMETALQFYEAAQDYLSLVRVYCYCEKIDKAAEICNETGDRAACYHLGRHYENTNKIREAIHFFTRARAFGNAIRLCKEQGMEDQLMNLALLSNPENMVEAARYYEFKTGHQDKAVMLYHKAGHFSKALELAFRTKQFAALQMISEDLDDKTDPELLQRCADFFIENHQFDRAVDLLAIARKYWDALKLCMEQHVPVNEDLVEKLTPGTDLGENEIEEKNKILEGIAEVCMQQRQYHLATKKYTQAGNKVKAMKALLKSGDTEKIVFFAGVSRQKEIYVMAANYLQSLDWRKDPEIMKNIISFYTKGRALDLLAGFYDACAMVEIDEFQNYDKALGALSEAFKCMSKAKTKNQSQQEEKLSELKNKITLIKKFVQARRTYDEDAEEAIKQCQVLLEEPNVDNAVRMGDIYGFMVEHYARKEKWKAAYNCMEEMKIKIPKVTMAYYINVKTIENVHRALDIAVPKGNNVNGVQMSNGAEEEDGEEVEEDVIDDYTDPAY